MKDRRFRDAIEKFDAIHLKDSERIRGGAEAMPRALFYHQRLTYWVERLDPDPSECLLLAARCQHVQRKAIPRERFPMDKTGYRNWRTALADFHVLKASEVLQEAGYSELVIERVGDFLKKKGLKSDAEVQLFENAICLVFLELDLEELSNKHEEEKMVGILRRTWNKMSLAGHHLALELATELPRKLQVMITKAVQGSESA